MAANARAPPPGYGARVSTDRTETPSASFGGLDRREMHAIMVRGYSLPLTRTRTCLEMAPVSVQRRPFK